MLYQSGYLTIKRYDEKLGIYRLGFPNREVEEGFVCFLLPYYASVDKVESPFEIIYSQTMTTNGLPDLRKTEP